MNQRVSLKVVAVAAVMAALLAAHTLLFPWLDVLPVWPLFLAGIGLMCFHTVGRAALHLLAADAVTLLSRWEVLPFSVALGAVVHAYVLFALAAIQRVNPVTVLVVPLGLAALAWAWGQGKWTPPSAGHLLRGPGPGWDVTLGVFTLIPIAACVAPSLYYDALVYHFPVTVSWLEHGGLRPIPTLVYASFPPLFELLALPALVLESTGIVANLWSAALGVAALAAIADVCRLLAGPRAAWWCALLAASSPVLSWVRYLQSSDVGIACFAALAANALIRHARTANTSWLLVAGVMGGSALFSKNIAVFFVLPFVVAIGTVPAPRRLRALVILGGIPLLMGLPTFIRNAVFTGNPFMPALFGLLGGEGWSEEQAALLATEAHQSAGILEQLKHIPGLLQSLLLGPSDGMDDRVAGPLFLVVLVPVLLLSGTQRAVAVRLLALLVLQLVGWLWTYPQGRFLAAPLLTWCVVGGMALAALWDAAASPLLRRSMTLILACLLLAHASLVWRGISVWQGNWVPVVLGSMDRDSYLATSLDYPAATPALQRVLQDDEHVLVVGDARCFHLQVPCVTASVLDHHPMLAILKTSQTAEEVARQVRATGAGAILLRPNELARLTRHVGVWRLDEREAALLVAYLQAHARQVFRTPSGGSVVYDLH